MSLSVKHTDGDAGSAETTRLLPALATGWVLLILAIAVVLLRLFQLSEAPPGFFFDEGAHGLDALRVLKGEHAVFFSGNNGREGLVVYAAALSIASLGRTPLAIRLPTALASASTVFAVFWLGQLLFGRDESGRATPWRGLIIFQGIATYHTYFQRWAHAPETYNSHGAAWRDLAEVLNARAPVADTAYLLPQAGSSEQYGFEYLYTGTTSARILDSTLPTLPEEARSALASVEHLATVKVVDWTTDAPRAEKGDRNIILLMGKYGKYAASEEFDSFYIHAYTDIDIERPWTFYGQIEPVKVRYHGGIELRGLALGLGEEQLPSRQLFDLGQARSLWVALQWQTDPSMDADYAISMRLYSSEGALSFQRDVVLGNRDHARTSQWSAEKVVNTVYNLDFPAELLSGEYELRLIVYDTETLTPAAASDGWEPELVLTRLRLAGPQ